MSVTSSLPERRSSIGTRRSLLIVLAAIACTATPLSAQHVTDALRYVPNRGQIVDAHGAHHREILYSAASPGLRAYVGATGVSYVLYRLEPDTSNHSVTVADHLRILPHLQQQIDLVGDPEKLRVVGHRVDVRFVGANQNPRVEESEPAPDFVNIYRGSDLRLTRIPRFGRVVLRNVWPRIDLVLKSQGAWMKYEFVVHPGGDPSDIVLAYDGANELEVGADGELRVSTSVGELRDGVPVAWQSAFTNVLTPDTIATSFAVANNLVRFVVGEYDRTKELVIDPTLVWSTYYGGSNNDYSYGWGGGWGWGGLGQGMSVDPSGNVYTAGGTFSTDFPVTTGAFSSSLSGLLDAYIVSFTSNGTRRWATYMGGTNHDYCNGLDASSEGFLVVAGTTTSTDFPVTPGAFQSSLRGSYDAIIARFDTAGTLVWSTYFGGSYLDWGGPIALDRYGHIALGGSTLGGSVNDFPVTFGTFQSPNTYDMWVARFDTNGNRNWATYVGGGAQDWGGGVDVDSSGRIVISGTTYSSNFPTTSGTIQPSWSPGAGDTYQAALALFDSSGTLVWGTYFGGSSYDWMNNAVFDARGYIYSGGGTYSPDLPTSASSIQQNLNSGSIYDLYLLRLKPNGTLSWCTYYGGTGWEYPSAMSIAPNGHLYATGYTASADLLRSGNSYQATIGGLYDAFTLEVDSLGRLIWDSYLGSSQYDYGTGITGDGSGSVYVSGYTNGTNFPVRNAFQPSLNQNSGSPSQYWDAFISRFCNTLYPVVSAEGPTSFCDGDSVVIEGPGGYDSYRWSPNNEASRSIVVRRAGNYSVFVTDAAGCSGNSDTARIVVHQLPRPVIQVIGDLTFCQGDSVVFRVRYPGARGYLWSTGSVSDSVVIKNSGTYAVEVTDSNGCVGLAPSQTVVVRPRPQPAVISPRGPVYVCADSTATISIDTSFYRVEWNTGETTHGITVGPGAYWARVYNSVNCSNRSDTVVVIERPRPSVTISPRGPILMCQGDSVRLDAGGGYARYKWSTGDTTRSIMCRTEGTYTVSIIDSNGCPATSTAVRITEYGIAAPSIVVLGKRAICSGDSVQLDGGIGLYKGYRWSTGDTTPRIWVRKSGRYTVTVTTFDGCNAGSASEDITVVARPNVSIAGPVEICTGSEGTYSVDAKPGLKYEWTQTGGVFVGPSNGPTATIAWNTSGSGTVTVKVTNSTTGCDSSVTVGVVIGNTLRPNISYQRDIVCPGDSVELDAGAGYTEYDWSNGATSRTIWGKPGGTYRVTVRNAAGCGGTSAPITLREATPPTPTIVAGGSLSLCMGDSVTLDAGAGYASYLWSDGSIDRVLVVHDAGRFSVEVVDTNGCRGLSAPVDVIVNPKPRPDIAGPVEVCRNSISTYSTTRHSGSAYSWRVSGGTIQSGQGTDQIVVQWGAAGGGTVDVEESSSAGCIGNSAQLTVTVGTQLRPTVTPSGSIGFCPGDSVILDAGGGYATYAWSTGDTTRTLVVRVPGQFFVAVTDGAGCSGRSSDVTVNAWPTPIPVIRALGPTTFVQGDSVVLEVDLPYAAYRWSNGRTTRRITVKTNGTYAIEVTDSNGCSGTSVGHILITVITPTNDTADVRLSIARVIASPGDVVTVPIRMSETKLATSGVTRVRGNVTFNSSLLYPRGATSAGSIRGGERIVPIDVQLTSPTTGSDLVQLEFTALLGNDDRTVIGIEDVEFIGGVVRLQVDSGEFRLDGLCRDGGTRLVNTDGAFGIKAIRPNPASDVMEVEYEVVEDGPARIHLTDLLGKTTIPVMVADLRHGRYLVTVPVRSISTGTYALTLSSGHSRVTQFVQVSR